MFVLHNRYCVNFNFTHTYFSVSLNVAFKAKKADNPQIGDISSILLERVSKQLLLTC